MFFMHLDAIFQKALPLNNFKYTDDIVFADTAQELHVLLDRKLKLVRNMV